LAFAHVGQLQGDPGGVVDCRHDRYRSPGRGWAFGCAAGSGSGEDEEGDDAVVGGGAGEYEGVEDLVVAEHGRVGIGFLAAVYDRSDGVEGASGQGEAEAG